MEKGLFFMIESEGELIEEALAFDPKDPGTFFKSQSTRVTELSSILRSLGRRADFSFAEQAYYELERELGNARKLLSSLDRTPQSLLSRHLQNTTERLNKINSGSMELKDQAKAGKKEKEKYALNTKHANLAVAYIKATPEVEFLTETEERIRKELHELETLLSTLSPLIKQAYLPPLPHNLGKILEKQQRALNRINESKSPENNLKAFTDSIQETLAELKRINKQFPQFLERTAEALELLEKALLCWAHVRLMLLKYEQDLGTLNKAIAQVLEGANFNEILQLERKSPDVEPQPLPIPAKQARFLQQRLAEIDGGLSDAQWKLFASMQTKSRTNTGATSKTAAPLMATAVAKSQPNTGATPASEGKNTVASAGPKTGPAPPQ